MVRKSAYIVAKLSFLNRIRNRCMSLLRVHHIMKDENPKLVTCVVPNLGEVDTAAPDNNGPTN